ncbi:MAG: hypothetical protein ACLQED_04010 [Desulfobaccales bacterium]
MRKVLPLVFVLVLGMVVAASAATVTFDDAYANSIVTDIYYNGSSFSDMGLTFTNSGTYMLVWGPGSPNSNGTNNLIFAGYNTGDSLAITKTGGGAFNLNSLEMSISWYDSNAAEVISVNGSPITLSQGIQTYALNLVGVTEVDITGVPSNSGYWLADNINTNVPVPLPPSMLLLGSGLLGLVGFRRFKKS